MSESITLSARNVDDIVGRLICFNALLDAIRQAMDDDDKMVDAMSSASDLLTCICRDFQADIDSADICSEGASA